MKDLFFAMLTGKGGWLLQTTLQASVLIVVLLLLKYFVRHRFPARWHAALWILVILRMAIPTWPNSSISVWNSAHLLSSLVDLSPSSSQGDVTVASRILTSSTQFLHMSMGHPSKWLHLPLLSSILLSLYILGMFFVAGSTIACFLRLWCAIRVRRPVTEQRVLDLLEDCKSEMGVTTALSVVETNIVKSPALFGCLRPRLILPIGLTSRLELWELRHVFLHELAHLRRGDIYWGWLATALLALHWFNPLVWVAFSRLRNDREMACDEMAMGHLGADGALAYGQTLLRLLESKSRLPALAALVGVVESTIHMKRRLSLVASYRPSTFRWSILTVSPIVLLAALFLTNMRPLKAWGQFSASSTQANWGLVDLPFTDDPKVHGGWRGVASETTIEAFNPKEFRRPKKFVVKQLHFLPNGRTSWSFRWTKDAVISFCGRMSGAYAMRSIQGTDYLFVELKMMPDLPQGIQENGTLYYVFERDPSLVFFESRKEDNIDFPFNDDSRILGQWRGVDYVFKKEEFVPGVKQWPHELFLKEITFYSKGGTNGPWTWTKWLVIHPEHRSASAYQVQTINGHTYLFLEWKGEDYLSCRLYKPWLMVLQKVE